MQLILFLAIFLMVTNAFELLPYVHIDYGHYARLAQCQAKCAQTYGTLSRRRMNDGSLRAFINTSSEHYDICETGCMVHSRSSDAMAMTDDAATADAPLFDALRRGQNFWWESVAAQAGQRTPPSLKSREKSTRKFDSIRVLCIERQRSRDLLRVHTDDTPNAASNSLLARFGLPSRRRSIASAATGAAIRQLVLVDTFEATLSAYFADKPNDDDNDQSARYVVLWRQKTKISIGEIVERGHEEMTATEAGDNSSSTDWITASIELSTTFRVEGIQPGILYRFLLVPIRADGRPGDAQPAKSDWIDFGTMIQVQKSFRRTPATLSFFSHFNSNDQVAAVARWMSFDDVHATRLPPDNPQLRLQTETQEPESNRSERTDQINIRRHSHRRMPIFDGCQLQLDYWNRTSHVVEVFEMDDRDGIALRNLAFGSEYTVRIQSAIGGHDINDDSKHSNKDERYNQDALNGRFKSLTCAQIHGADSLECEPEPVRNLAIHRGTENDSAVILVKWTPTANTLLHHLYCAPVDRTLAAAVDGPTACSTLAPSLLYFTANTSEARLVLPTLLKFDCEFELRVIKYDLLGREAIASTRFSIASPTAGRRRSSAVPFDTALAVWRVLWPHAGWIAVALASVAVLTLIVILARRHVSARRRVWFRRWRAASGSTAGESTAGAVVVDDDDEPLRLEKDLSARIVVTI